MKEGKSAYKLIIFDLDGTILDTSEGIIEAICRTIATWGLPEPDRLTIKRLIGPPVEYAFAKLFDSENDNVEIKMMANVFRSIYFQEMLYVAKLYDGITELLKGLKSLGYITAVATNKREKYTKDLLKYFCVDDLFDVIHGTDEIGRLTKSDIIDWCVKEVGVDKNEALMVGDALSDSDGACKSGVDFAAVTYGFGFTGSNLPECVFRIDDPIELLKKL